MNFGGLFGGLGAVGEGMDEAQSRSLKNRGLDLLNQQQQFQLDQEKTNQNIQGLAGDALQILPMLNQIPQAQGGGGGAPAGPSPGFTRAPPAGPGQTFQPPVPNAPSGAPSVAAGPPGRAQAADPNNPANWTSFQVAEGPNQGTGGTFQPAADAPDQRGMGGGALGQPTPVQTQRITPPAPGGPPGPGGAGPPGAGGGPSPQGGGLTLDKVIQAVTLAAKRRGQQVTPDVIFGAVKQFLPLLQPDDKLRYLMMQNEYLMQRQAAQDAQRNYRQQVGEEGKDVRQGVAEEGKTLRQATAEEGKTSRLATTEAGKDTRLGTVEAGKDKRQEVAEAEKDARHAEDIASREKLAVQKAEAAWDRARLSSNTRQEIARAGVEGKIAIEKLREDATKGVVDMKNVAALERLGISIAGRQEIAKAAQEAQTARAQAAQAAAAQRQETGIEAAGARQDKALEERKRETGVKEQQSDRRLDQGQQRLDQAQARRGLLQRFFEEHPTATVEEAQAFMQTGRPPSATAAKEEDSKRQAGSVIHQLNSALDDVIDSAKGGPWVVGVKGDISRAKEVAGNITGFTDEATASNFKSKIDLLTAVAPHALEGTSRISNKDRQLYESVVRGIRFGDTRQNTIAALSYLREVLMDRWGVDEKGDPVAKQPKTYKPGDTYKGMKLKPGGDPTKFEDWEPEKQSSREEGGSGKPFRNVAA